MFILWLGWFGFNGGSQLALGSGADATAVADIFVNTNLAAAGGVLACMISKATNSHISCCSNLNGAIAGLVAITAEPLTPSMGQAVIIGAIGGIICMYGMKLLDMLKIDDVVGGDLRPPFRWNLGHISCCLDKSRCVSRCPSYRCSFLWIIHRDSQFYCLVCDKNCYWNKSIERR